MTLATVAKRAILSLAIMFLASLTVPLHSLGWAQVSAGVGAVTGSVKFVGEVPKAQKRSLDYDTIPCQTKAVPDESLVVGRDKGIRYAVVTLEGAAGSKPIVIPNKVQYLDCRHCRFVPHVVATTVGESVVIRDYDAIYHSLDAVVPGGKTLASWIVNPSGMTAAQSRPTFVPDKPGVVAVICSAHPWMVAYVVVTDTPYYAVTDQQGHYEISGVPPGNYVLKVWTERLGQQEEKVVLNAGSLAKANFKFSLSGKRSWGE